MKKSLFVLSIPLLLSACGGSTQTSSQTILDSSNSEPSISINSSSEAKQKLEEIDYVKLLCLKEDYDHIYTWGNHSTKGWPGEKLTKTWEKDDRWYCYDVKDASSFNFIFNDGNNKKTGDLNTNGNGYYFVYDNASHKRDTIPNLDGEFVEYEAGTYNASLYRNTYQLLVYSFADSDEDGIGDFKGIADHLDYLKDMGIESIWLSPINKAASYHAYDVIDYYSINPKYEVNNFKFTDLVNAAHNKGINIILDLVLNHTSDQHNWYKSEHRNWYASKDAFPGSMHDLNYDIEEVRTEIKKVGTYWLDQGADGFRLDAAMWIYNNNDGSVNHEKNFTWWKEWCGAMRAKKNDVYIVGEVLDKNHDLAYQYAEAGFNSTFDFNSLENVYKAVNSANYNYINFVSENYSKAKDINKEFILARALSNHDIGRFSQDHPAMDGGETDGLYFEDFDSLRLANAINMLTPGNTYVYYGDELGLKGKCINGYNDMDYRTPMLFASQKTNSEKYFQNFKGQGKSTSTSLSGKNADQDKTDSSSMYNVFKNILNMKKEHTSIKYGKMLPINNLTSGLSGFRVVGEEDIAIIYNPSAKGLTQNISGTSLYQTDGVSFNSGNLAIPSKGIAVIKL